MSREAFRLVLLVSCAHALVHIYELTFASVEQDVQVEMVQRQLEHEVDAGQLRRILDAVRTPEHLRDASQRAILAPHESLVKESIKQIGILGTAWALPFGLGAFAAGWLADRFGSKRVLVFYLIGCGVLCLAVAAARHYTVLLAAMFAMGSLASLYHPAGLSLISRATTARTRGVALGYHGVLGSAGIAGAPFLAAVLLGLLDSWRGVYAVLVVPGVVLGIVLAVRLRNEEEITRQASSADVVDDSNRWLSFATYCGLAWLVGVTYRAFTLFLPRYLAGAGIVWIPSWITHESFSNYLAAAVLTVGILGQYVSGHLAGRFHLEKLLAGILLAHVPFLLWMGMAEGAARLCAAAGLAFFLFMIQPVGNSLVAKYVSTRRRSLGYGLAFLVSFGLGSVGATFAGVVQEHENLSQVYLWLGGILGVAMILAVGLWVAEVRRLRRAA
jgi:FSR family fosmidomycin resistance protein-like MFS transporter